MNANLLLGRWRIGKRIESGGYLDYKFTVAESLGRAGRPGSVELFDEVLAEAKIITTGGTGEHGETQGKAETVTLRSGQT
jgi:hypothetical protein